MLFSARAVASALSGQTGLLDKELFHSLDSSRDLYLYKLINPMPINGKTDDWLPQLQEAREFGENNLLSSPETYSYESLHYKHLTGVRGEYLYAVFVVTDRNGKMLDSVGEIGGAVERVDDPEMCGTRVAALQ